MSKSWQDAGAGLRRQRRARRELASAAAIHDPAAAHRGAELRARPPLLGKRRHFSSNAVNSGLGSPTSKLSYDGMNGNSDELVWRGQNEAKTFAKGFIGGGGLNGGTLDDEVSRRPGQIF